MALLEKHLVIRKSKIPGAGKGLFTKAFIPKGTRIVEYTGRITTWKNVLEGKFFNGYVYYINRNYVIDAMRRKTALARYANDANGLTKSQLFNNTKYVVVNKRVFLQAKKDIEAGEEILVSYGNEYWNVISEQKKSLEREKKKKQ